MSGIYRVAVVGAPARLHWSRACALPSCPSSAWPCGGRCQPETCSAQPVSPTAIPLHCLHLTLQPHMLAV